MPLPPYILCEGLSDEVFLQELMDNRGITGLEIRHLKNKKPKANENQSVCLDDEGGCNNFHKRLQGLRTQPDIQERKSIVIIADNDDNPSDSFKNIQNEIKKANIPPPVSASPILKYNIPDHPRTLTARGEMPPVVIIMLPWDDVHGCLESYCLETAYNKRPQVAECVDKFIECNRISGWPISKLSKIKLRSLMSAGCPSDPNVGLPHAWSTNNGKPGDFIPLDHRSFNLLAEYLKTLA